MNVALLGINGWLVYLLGRHLLPDGDNMRWSKALIAGLLFVCYPFHNEPQLWIIGRSTAMATMFTLLALVVATSRASMINKCITVGLCGALGALCYGSPCSCPCCWLRWPSLHPRWSVRLGVDDTGLHCGRWINLLLRSLLTGNVASKYGASFFSHAIVSYFGMTIKVFARLFLLPNPNTSVQALLIAVLVPALVVVTYFIYRRTKNEPANRNLFFALAMMIVVASATGNRRREHAHQRERSFPLPAFGLPVPALGVRCRNARRKRVLQ